MTWHLVPDAPAVFTETPIPADALRGLRHKQAPNGVTVVAHDYATWREMRKRGMVVPSPLARYDWPGGKTPWPHQISTAEFLLEPGNEWCLVANGLGLGKTNTALWAADYLMKQGAIRRALIVAPLSVCSHVWARTIFTDLPHRKAAVAHGPADKRKLLCADKSLDFVIVNHDGLHIIADTVASEPFDLIIYDEATAVKTTTSRRWKTLAKLRMGRRLWMMTGTPTPQSPLDAYGLLRLLRRDRPFGFAQWRSMTMEEASRFKWKARESSERTIATWLQPATRYRSTEVFDVQYEDIEVDLSSEQARLCSELKNAAAAELADAKINVANAAALLSKILQVQCGGVYCHDPAGERVSRTVEAKAYFDEIVRFISEADTPVLVFAPFQAAVSAIHKAISDAGFPAGLITGAVPQKARVPLFDGVLSGELRALVAVPETMSHGLTLTTARYVLWCAPPFKAESYEQANGRVIRPGQRNGVVIAHIVPSKLVRSLYARLKSKGRLQDAVLQLLSGA